jgi:RNA recognition motif-containing protein
MLRKSVSSPDVCFEEFSTIPMKTRKMSIASESTACDFSPRSSWSGSSVSSFESVEVTVMIRHIPCKYAQEQLMQEVLEFTSNFDYFYLPPARTAKVEKNLGYAFVNFTSQQEAEEFIEAFQGYQFKAFPNSLKRAQVNLAELQGVEANVESYWNSKVDKTKFAPWILQN